MLVHDEIDRSFYVDLHEMSDILTVDREIFAVKKFLPVAWAAKIKYTYTCFIAEPLGGEN